MAIGTPRAGSALLFVGTDNEWWRDEAACKDMETDIFFPERGEDPRPAMAVCKICPVRAECLEYALETRQFKGVWGGTSERQRRRLVKERRLATEGTG